MTFLYWLSLALGGGLFLLSLAGEVMDSHGHFHLGGGDHADDGDFDWGTLFSVRYATYFLFGFGAVGSLLSLLWSGDRSVLVAAAAVITGIAAWLISATVFGYIRGSDSGDRQTDAALVGRVGEITLPLLHGRTGKVEIMRAAGTQELLARPMDDAEPDAENWRSVVIVEVRDGVAYVAPYSEETRSN